VHEKRGERLKTRALERGMMYRVPEKVPEFEKFDMVFGGRLNRQNRWVILADLIPWDKVEEKYAQLFVTNNGRPALPVRVTLGALIVKEKKKISDEELVEDIREGPYLKRREKTIRKALKKQLQYVERNVRIISDYKEIVGFGVLTRKQYRDLTVISELVRQQRELYTRKSRSIEGRILSISKPHVRPIARGKARMLYEFGAKLSVSLVDGLTEVHRLSREPYNENQDLKGQIETYRQRYGRHPEVVCAERIYRTRENLRYCQEYGIRLSGPKLGRPLSRSV